MGKKYVIHDAMIILGRLRERISPKEDVAQDQGKKEQGEGDGGQGRLGTRVREVLKAMLGLKAFDFDNRTTQAVVVGRINRMHNPANYRRAFRTLSDKKWTEGERGSGMGTWLTVEGRRIAETVQQRDAAKK